jgi:hypothetical protein
VAGEVVADAETTPNPINATAAAASTYLARENINASPFVVALAMRIARRSSVVYSRIREYFVLRCFLQWADLLTAVQARAGLRPAPERRP